MFVPAMDERTYYLKASRENHKQIIALVSGRGKSSYNLRLAMAVNGKLRPVL
jgi:hypothetical protein